MNRLSQLSRVNNVPMTDNMEKYKILTNEMQISPDVYYKYHADGTPVSDKVKITIESEYLIKFSTVTLTEYYAENKISIESAFVYDANNKLITRRWSQFSYDNNGKLNKHLYQRFGTGSKIEYRVEETFGDDEKRVSQTKEEFSYDNNDKLIGIYAITNDANGKRISGTNTFFEYDVNGELIGRCRKKYNGKMTLLSEKTDKLNAAGNIIFSVEKTFGIDGKQIISQTDREFEYNEEGKRTGIFAIRKNKNGTQTGSNNRYFEYDKGGKEVTRINKKFGARQNLLRKTTYGYNIDNQWVIQDDSINNKAAGNFISEAKANNDITLLKDAITDNKFSAEASPENIKTVNKELIPVFVQNQF